MVVPIQKRVAALFVDILAVGSILFSETSVAMDLQPASIRGDAKKNPVSVLQNRYFMKVGRPEVGFIVGSFLNESYTDTSSVGLRAALFATEWLGFEYQYSDTSVKDSDDRRALNQIKYRSIDTEETISPDPEVNSVHGMIDGNIIFAPFYGKMNLMNYLIVYSDVYFTTGVTKVDTDQGDITGVSFGAGQRFYWERSISMRVDFRDRIYTETRAGKDSRKHTYTIDFGLSYFFI